MGALSNQLYTMIVAMAVVTTMAMPPTLRWMMARVPLGDEEAKRLDKEEAEQPQNLPKMERALVYVDDSPNGRLAARLAGLFAARQQMLTTVLEHAPTGQAASSSPASREQARRGGAGHDRASGAGATQLVPARPAGNDDALEKEIAHGYDIAFVGVDRPIAPTTRHFEDRLQELVDDFDGPVAIAVNGAGAAGPADVPLDILLPTSGTQDARLATEIALALAHASKGTLTALHVFHPQDDTELLRGRARRPRHVGAGRRPSPRQAQRRAGQGPDRDQRPIPRPRSAAPLRGGRFDLVRDRHLAAPGRDQVPRAAHGGAAARRSERPCY